MEPVKFRGTPIYLDGRTWILPPLSVGQWQDYEADLARAKEAGEEKNDRLSTLALIQMAFTRNYPEITFEWLRQSLDASTLKEAIEALAKDSGLVANAPGE